MEQNDKAKLGLITYKSVYLYTLQGEEMVKEKTLDDYASVNNDKNNSFRFVADFKNILILRLLGGSKFKLVPKTPELKLI